LTEEEFLSNANGYELMANLDELDHVSRRTYILLGVAVARSVLHLTEAPELSDYLDLAERGADDPKLEKKMGLAANKVDQLQYEVWVHTDHENLRWAAVLWALVPLRRSYYLYGDFVALRRAVSPEDLANLIREFVNPFHAGAYLLQETKRPSEVPGRENYMFGELIVQNPCWRTAQVLELAQAAYDEKRPEEPKDPLHSLDPVRLAILSDAMEEMGCDDRGLLDHLRSPLPHYRGCWALDVVLDKRADPKEGVVGDRKTMAK
jgi:hypothetical protein